MNAMTDRDTNPWYREPWPWLLMAGPAVVVVAGIATAVIAIRTNDGVVAEDYYKQGLAVNRVKARDARAEALGMDADVQFNEEHDRVRVVLRGGSRPESLTLRLVHPTRAGEDQVVALAHAGGGVYEARIAPPGRGKWSLRIEDREGTWRIGKTWRNG
jgi:uncharacterized protein